MKAMLRRWIHKSQKEVKLCVSRWAVYVLNYLCSTAVALPASRPLRRNVRASGSSCYQSSHKPQPCHPIMRLSARLHAWLNHQCKLAHVEKSTDRGDLQGDFWFITLRAAVRKLLFLLVSVLPFHLISLLIFDHISAYPFNPPILPLSSLSPLFSPLPRCCLIRKSDPSTSHTVLLLSRHLLCAHTLTALSAG